ncbi:class I lanthipeptide [Sunxiuqinia dokdonensis]|uniref:class I lanthipeptide n=1 Tax=Sunxiuqinia dokdonensis TaxID=1409788 RepID=UPI00069CDB88|nr:class I lanthipeptide [Sunxiuqinia dokdonensis]
MEKKKLKRLELKKQRIVELNDVQQSNVVGGTSPITTVTYSSNLCVATISAIVGSVIGYTIGGGDEPPAQPSDQLIYTGPNGEPICEITGVDVYGSAQYC